MAEKWIQKAAQRMKAKGTLGSLRRIAAAEGGLTKRGTISMEWLLAQLKSASPIRRKKANFALNVRKK